MNDLPPPARSVLAVVLDQTEAGECPLVVEAADEVKRLQNKVINLIHLLHLLNPHLWVHGEFAIDGEDQP